MRIPRLAVCLVLSLLAPAGPASAALSVTGTVLGPSGLPLARARVELQPVPSGYAQGLLNLENPGGSPPRAAVPTDAAGRYSISAPEPGIWRVFIRSAGMVDLQSQPLPLVAPMELAPAFLEADAGAPLRLADRTGKPLANAWIVASGSADSGDWRPAPRMGRTDAAGALALERRDGEALAVSVFLPGRAEIVRGGFTGGLIEVPDGGDSAREIRVVSRTGEPVPDTVVRVGPRAWTAGRTDAQGRLRLALPASGSTPLLLLSPDGRQAITQAPAAGSSEGSVLLPSLVTLSGRVIDGTGRKPVAGALVWASADPGAFVRADAEGRFQLPAPARRRFEVEVLAPGFLPRKLAIPGPQLASGKPVTLALDRAGALRGQIVDAQSRPVAGAEVVAVPAAALSPRALDPADPVAERTVSDVQGRFQLRLLQPQEDYEVRALRSGSWPAARTATVGDPGAAPRTVKLVLTPARGARGRIQDPAGKPVAGAEVTLRASLRPGSLQVLPLSSDAPIADKGAVVVQSDGQGGFSFPAAPAPEMELLVRRDGYAPTLLPALRLPAGTGPADLGVVVLRPGAPIAGRVLDQRGRPVLGAEVFALREAVDANSFERTVRGRKPAADSAADGRFLLKDLPADTPVHLAVRAEGFLPGLVRAVRPPTAEPPLVIRLEPENRLIGRVVDDRGEPIAGARVEMRWQATLPQDAEIRVGEPVFRTARSEGDGRFTLRGIPTGGATFSVAAPGFVEREGIAVDLPRPAGAGELRIEMDRGALLQGRVTTASGEPVPAVRVGVGGAIATTDDDGLYWLEGAALGHQEILFLHPSQGRVRRDFDVQPGVNVLDVSFDPGVEVAGRAVDDRGRPVSGARVELNSWDRFELRQFQDVTDDEGRFRLSPVGPGRYRLTASAEGYADAELASPVEIAAESPAPLEIAIPRGARVSGRILGLPADELTQVRVVAVPDGGAGVDAWTDGLGRYEAGPLPPGDWTLKATVWGDERRAETRLAVSRSDREIERDLEIESGVTLTVQVLSDEEPVADARVSLRGYHVGRDRTAMTDYEGRVRIDDLEPDTYRIGVTQAQKLLVHNGEVDLEQDRELVIRFETAALSGVVASADGGAPIAEALVSLRPLEGPDYMVAAGTKEDGRFGLHHVQPGRYRLEAKAQGFTAAAQEVQLAAGQDVEGFEIRLEPAAGAKLRVRLASGAAPALVHILVRDPAGATVLADTRPANASGEVDLASLPAGAWSLFASADGGAVSGSPLLVPSDPVALTLPPAGRLQVRVPALLSASRQGTLRLLSTNGQPFWTLGPGGSVVSAWPLLGGKAVVDGVPAGTWLLQVEAPDGQRWQRTAATTGTDAAMTIE